jgi:glycosyltransferase involved in cell wall biosynthesis
MRLALRTASKQADIRAMAHEGNPAMPHEPTVAIWRSELLPGSETFIRHQAEAMTRWRPRVVGGVKVDSPAARAADSVAYSAGPWERVAWRTMRLTGRSSRVESLLAASNPTLVHAHFGGEGWLIGSSARHLGVPMVLTVHGADVTAVPRAPGIRGVRGRWKLRRAFDQATIIIAVSQFIRSRAIECGADPAKVRVHHVGIPLPRFPAVAPKHWDVVFVGRFVEKKGIDDLLVATAAVRGVPRPRCVLVGGGPLERQMRERARQLGVDATFVGPQPPVVVEEYLARSRVFVGPSRTAANGDAEGLGMVFLEAASHGLPVCSYRHGGVPEAVRHGETGLLCEEGDVRSLADNIRRLLVDDGLRSRLGSRARQHVERDFDVLRNTRTLEDLYDEVVGEPVTATLTSARRRRSAGVPRRSE